MCLDDVFVWTRPGRCGRRRVDDGEESLCEECELGGEGRGCSVGVNYFGFVRCVCLVIVSLL